MPRIGSAATAELSRYRQAGLVVMVLPIVAGACGLLIGTNTLGDVLGVALAAVVAWRLAAFIHAQMRVAAALSEWYGVKIRTGQLPLMNPKRFDAWCERFGLQAQAEQADGARREFRTLGYDHNWGPLHWSGRGPRTPSS